ncbi:hypothetical protein [Desulfonatronospira sp.]|uniref:hypothetical protein n=1 Tax=Desulfonatronospira sp. TaxID=1962951 RepID=UPI0025BE45F4|nr:hypothetical protein [Desulfonatronospira sp.]
MIMDFRALCIFCCVLLLAAACAPKRPPVERPPGVVWEDFWSRTPSYQEDQPFFIRGSVNYSTSREQRRVQAVIWGFAGYPVRMDLSAGFGQTVSMWLEDKFRWEAYNPGENTRYVHHDGSRGATLLGFPTPMDLRQTSLVLLGDFQHLIPGRYNRVESRDNMWKYYFDNSNVTSVLLDQQGNLQWVAGDGWQVEFKGYEQENGLFYFSRLDMQLSGDREAVIRIQAVDMERDWDEKQMSLELPDDTRTIFLH